MGDACIRDYDDECCHSCSGCPRAEVHEHDYDYIYECEREEKLEKLYEGHQG